MRRHLVAALLASAVAAAAPAAAVASHGRLHCVGYLPAPAIAPVGSPFVGPVALLQAVLELQHAGDASGCH